MCKACSPCVSPVWFYIENSSRWCLYYFRMKLIPITTIGSIQLHGEWYSLFVASVYEIRLTFKLWLTSIRWGDNHSVALVEERQTVVISQTAWYPSQFGSQQSKLIEFRVRICGHNAGCIRITILSMTGDIAGGIISHHLHNESFIYSLGLAHCHV